MSDFNNEQLEELAKFIDLHDKLIEKLKEKITPSAQPCSNEGIKPEPVDVRKVDNEICKLRSHSIWSWIILSVVFFSFIFLPLFFINKGENNVACNKCCCVEVLDSLRSMELSASDTLNVCNIVEMTCVKISQQERVLNTCLYALWVVVSLGFILAVLKILSKTIEKRADLRNDYYRALYDLKIRGIRESKYTESSNKECDCCNMLAVLALILSLIAFVCVCVVRIS
jgi:hypothetical protein